MCIVCVLTWFLLGVKKKLGLRPERSLLGVQFKISDEHPTPFICGVPPPGSISPSFLNRVAILMHFALKRVRIEGFQQHSLNQTSFKSPPPPPREVSSLIHNDNLANPALPVFSELKTVTRTTHCKYGKPLQCNLYSGDTLGTMVRVPCNLVPRALFPGFGGAREERPGDEVGSLE